MTKADLINTVAKAAKLSKRAAGDAVDASFQSVAGAIKRVSFVPDDHFSQ